MARKPMRSQLNQIRAWVRQGRTDAWIAHQLDISASELRDFIRRNNLSADEEESDDIDLRDEIEAEIEAAMESEEDEEEDEEDEESEADEDGDEEPEAGEDEEPEEGSADRGAPSARGGRAQSADAGEGTGRRRRRRRRRGPKRAGAGLEATFDHGDADGFGLWLDPVVESDPVYAEHWKGHRRIKVTIEPEQIVIRRADGDD